MGDANGDEFLLAGPSSDYRRDGGYRSGGGGGYQEDYRSSGFRDDRGYGGSHRDDYRGGYRDDYRNSGGDYRDYGPPQSGYGDYGPPPSRGGTYRGGYGEIYFLNSSSCGMTFLFSFQRPSLPCVMFSFLRRLRFVSVSVEGSIERLCLHQPIFCTFAFLFSIFYVIVEHPTMFY